MTESRVDTVEGRAELRRLADREYSLEPDWYVPFQAALHLLDSKDLALAETQLVLETWQRVAKDLERQLIEARERIAELEERLEIAHVYNLKGERIEQNPRLPFSLDGISCRDETIRLQDEQIERSAAEITRLRALLAATGMTETGQGSVEAAGEGGVVVEGMDDA